jgi:protein NRD1
VGLDVNQLALLQQLTQNANVSAPPTSGNPGLNFRSQHVPQPSMMGMGGRNGDSFAGPSTSQQQQMPSYHESTSRPPGYVGPRYGAGRGGGGAFDDEYYDGRRDTRGSGRGGRGGRGRGRWVDGDDKHHSWNRRSPRDRDWGSRSPQASLPPPLMTRGRYNRSRSRSPPPRNRMGGSGSRRESKPYSPSGRSVESITQSGATVGPEKDEFGRDIRPMSVDGDNEPLVIAPSSSAQNTSSGISLEKQGGIVGAPIPTYVEPDTASGSTNTKLKPANSGQIGVATASMQSLPIATYESRDVDGGGGLQNFDFTKFEFTSPASWEALGKAWQVTNGYFPSQEELLQLVMMSTGVAAIAGGISGGTEGDTFHADQDRSEQWPNDKGASKQGQNWDSGGAEETAYETITDSWGVSAKSENSHGADENQIVPVVADGSVGSSGKMQKVGDRWIFVRS